MKLIWFWLFGPKGHPILNYIYPFCEVGDQVLHVSLLPDVLLRVLLIVQQLLQENRHGSKRDIFYMHPSVFKGKSGLIDFPLVFITTRAIV